MVFTRYFDVTRAYKWCQYCTINRTHLCSSSQFYNMVLAAIVLMRFGRHDIRLAQTCLWPRSQPSSSAARSLRTTGHNWTLQKLGNKTMSQYALLHITPFSTVGVTLMKYGQNWFGTPWQLANFALKWALARRWLNHLLCATANPQFMVLARDNMVCPLWVNTTFPLQLFYW